MMVEHTGDHLKSLGHYKASKKRWLMLLIYGVLTVSNAALWTTYSPISDLSQTYFGGSKTIPGSITAINMLATTYQIFYAPGTYLAGDIMKRRGLRATMLMGSILTAIGAFLRVIGDVSHVSDGCNYAMQLIGQSFAALGQPLYLNLVTTLASAWFPLSERDLATTICTLFNPLGSAIGNLIPIVFVSKGSNDSVQGMGNLLLAEFVMCVVPVALAYFFFEAAPPTPPSRSTFLKIKGFMDVAKEESDSAVTNALQILLPNDDLDPSTHLPANSSEQTGPDGPVPLHHNDPNHQLYLEMKALFRDRNYILLFVAFSLGIGLFNSVITLINQILAAQGYTNDDAGVFGAVLIVTGLIGAGVAGWLMEYTRAYRAILKWDFFLLLLSFLLLFIMLKPENYAGLLASFGLLGFFILGMLPIAVENAAEVAYPVDEEISVGMLFLGGNVIGIGYVFAIQALLTDADPPHEDAVPFLPSNMFVFGFALFCFMLILLYKGRYKRLENEEEAGAQIDGQSSKHPLIEQEA